MAPRAPTASGVHTASTRAGVKVVWHSRVFAAKWWNVGDPPDALVQHDWESPWSLIGPVAGHRPRAAAAPPRWPPNTYPDWSSIVSYDAGAKVERRSVGYVAKWATRGEDPAADRRQRLADSLGG